MSIPVIDVRNRGEKIEDLPPEMQRFFIFCEKMYDFVRFGTIWNDFVLFCTILYD